MKFRITLPGLLLILTLTKMCAGNSFAQESSEKNSGNSSPGKITVTTKSSDKLSGKFVAVSAEKLEIETTWGGRLSIHSGEIAEWLTNDEKLRTQIATTLPAQIKADPRYIVSAKPYAEAKASASAQAVKPESAGNTSQAAPARPALEKAAAWKRSVDFAYSMTRGNINASELNGAFSLSRKVGSRRFAFNSFGRSGARNGKQTASLLSATARYERTVAKLPTFAETIFEIDKIKLLDYRFSENIGVTLPVLKDDDQKLNLDFGTGYTHEEYSNGRESGTASGLLRASASQKIGEKAQLSQQVTMFSNLTKPESWRLQTDVSITMPITRFLALRVSGLNRFDNRPLNESVRRNDFSLLTGFKINF
jgi:putative salt-induced outer membrane protein YdiY